MIDHYRKRDENIGTNFFLGESTFCVVNEAENVSNSPIYWIQ
jgi:hypothetical protein